MQLDFFTATTSAMTLPGWGRVIASPADTWRARWTGDRNGWVFYRSLGAEWETWEPDLPHGIARVSTREQAEAMIETLTARYGDTPLIV
jgi:hypothetical protein